MRGQRLALVPIERALGGECRHTAREVAAEAGLELEALQAMWRALGLAVPDPDERVLGDGDVEAARIHRRVLDAGFEPDDLQETSRVLGRGMARYVDALRTTIAEAILTPGADEHELGRRFASVAEELVPLNAPWMEHVFSLQLRQMLRNEAITLQERTAGRGEDARAGDRLRRHGWSTQLGRLVDVDELGLVMWLGVAELLFAASRRVDEWSEQ